jgi:hypothetical protein
MINLLAAVDAADDPEHSIWYMEHVQGPIRDELLKVSNKIENRA